MINVKIDYSKVAAGLKRRSRRLQADLKVNMQQAGEAFIGDIVSNQMSGRPGLRRQTGNLAKSWFQKVTGTLETDIVLTIGTRTKYAAPHEFGEQRVPAHSVRAHVRRQFGKLRKVAAHRRKAHVRKFPKRLRVRARWVSRGLRMFRRAILRAYRVFSQ